MAITFNSGLSGPITRQLDLVTRSLGATYQRLSSGLRINHAADDAAGLAIADTLRADAKIYSQAVRNLNDGLSITDIQLGALTEMKNILTRQAELAEQAANGVYSSVQRKALDQEALQLSKEYNRIVATTTFNNQKLFDTSSGQIRLAGGIGMAETLLMPSITFGQTAYSSSWDGTYAANVSYAAGGHAAFSSSGDFDGDGDVDIAAGNSSNSTITIYSNNGDGTFKAGSAIAAANQPIYTVSGDLNGDGYEDIVASMYTSTNTQVFLSNGNGTFKTATYSGGSSGYGKVDLFDVNGDGKLDYVSTSGSQNSFNVFLNRGDGTFNNAVQYATGLTSIGSTVGDLTGDGRADILVTNQANTLVIWANLGNGTFSPSATIAGISTNVMYIGDLNNDGFNDFTGGDWASSNVTTVLSNGYGGWQTPIITSAGTNTNGGALVDINGDRYLDLLLSGYGLSATQLLLNDGTGRMINSNMVPTANGGWGATAADVNGDGVQDIIGTHWANGIEISIGGNTNPDLPFFDLRTAAKAKNALTGIRARLDQANLVAGGIGAAQSRIDASISNLRIRTENLLGAESQIRDVDVAQESAQLIRSGIIQKAAAALLGQANSQPKIILQLLAR